jgi:hypothetical protein
MIQIRSDQIRSFIHHIVQYSAVRYVLHILHNHSIRPNSPIPHDIRCDLGLNIADHVPRGKNQFSRTFSGCPVRVKHQGVSQATPLIDRPDICHEIIGAGEQPTVGEVILHTSARDENRTIRYKQQPDQVSDGESHSTCFVLDRQGRFRHEKSEAQGRGCRPGHGHDERGERDM